MLSHVIEVKRQLKYMAIRAGLAIIAALQLHRLSPSSAKNGLIFTLHHVRPDSGQAFSPNAILSITPEFLETVIQAVLQAGMVPVHVHDLPELLRNNPDNKRFVCFTLDDGYRNNAEYAAPIFMKYNIPFTIYITAGFAEHNRILWWETVEHLLRIRHQLEFDFGTGLEVLNLNTTAQKQAAFTRFAYYVDENDEDAAVAKIANLAQQCRFDPLQLTADLVMDRQALLQLQQAAGELVHFGAHSLKHLNLNHITDQRAKEEIKGSAKWLVNNLGKAPKSFSYPYGWKSAVNERDCEFVREAGFAVGVTTQPGMLEAASMARAYDLPRVSLNGYFQKQHYVKALISGIAFR